MYIPKSQRKEYLLRVATSGVKVSVYIGISVYSVFFSVGVLGVLGISVCSVSFGIGP